MAEDILEKIKSFQFKNVQPLDLTEMPGWGAESEASAQSSSHSIKPVRICGVRFAQMGRVFDFFCEDLALEFGAKVVVEMPEKGLMVGHVAKPPLTLDASGLRLQLRKVLRLASEEDLKSNESNLEFEKFVHQAAERQVGKQQLKMHLLRTESNLDRSKVMIYFAAEGRVDFRNLLRELVREVNSRVELRQVGSRDQAKERGALGPCGEETCCSRFLTRFAPVSIKMAREQGLSLTPTKVSGNCGRLKCCLAYEHPIYQSNLKSLPQKGKCVKCKSSGKCGVVKDIDVLKQQITVRMDDGTFAQFLASEVIEESSVKRHGKFQNETVVATTDTELLQEQIVGSVESEEN